MSFKIKLTNQSRKLADESNHTASARHIYATYIVFMCKVSSGTLDPWSVYNYPPAKEGYSLSLLFWWSVFSFFGSALSIIHFKLICLGNHMKDPSGR